MTEKHIQKLRSNSDSILYVQRIQVVTTRKLRICKTLFGLILAVRVLVSKNTNTAAVGSWRPLETAGHADRQHPCKSTFLLAAGKDDMTLGSVAIDMD